MDVNVESFCENSKKRIGGGVRGGGGWGLERSGWGGVRVDVIEELKFLGKFTKKFRGGRFWEGSGWGGGVRVDVNEELKFL